jgi:hypothetical protein
MSDFTDCVILLADRSEANTKLNQKEKREEFYTG